MREELTSVEHKKIMLELMSYIDRICRENKLEYSLAGGTLLGAVRHQGFIPWDDDADIFLMRKDYNKLISILKNNPSDNFFLLHEESENYFASYSKFISSRTFAVTNNPLEQNEHFGVFLDIFPYDDTFGEDSDIQARYLKVRKRLRDFQMSIGLKGLYNSVFIKRILKKFIYFPRFISLRLRRQTSNILRTKFLRSVVVENNKNHTHAGNILSQYVEREVFPKTILSDYTDIDFEGKKFRCITSYNEYLTRMYGNYMTLPPIENQVRKHGSYKFFLREES